jgi:hypothetical protein
MQVPEPSPARTQKGASQAVLNRFASKGRKKGAPAASDSYTGTPRKTPTSDKVGVLLSDSKPLHAANSTPTSAQPEGTPIFPSFSVSRTFPSFRPNSCQVHVFAGARTATVTALQASPTPGSLRPPTAQQGGFVAAPAGGQRHEAPENDVQLFSSLAGGNAQPTSTAHVDTSISPANKPPLARSRKRMRKPVDEAFT